MVASRFLAVLLAAVCLASSALAQSLAGDWTGTLEAGGQRLRLVLHLSEDASGALTGSLDSPDQGATGLAFDTIGLADGYLTMTMSRPKASSSGTVSVDEQSIRGAWSQGPGELPLTFTRLDPNERSDEQAALAKLEGAWAGTLTAGPQTLSFVVRVEKTADGYRAVADSPDQGAKDMPVSGVAVDGTAVHFEVGLVGGSYDGELDEAGGSITGEWRQGGGSFPLKLEKTDAPPALRRPQNPVEPYPYAAIEVQFRGGADEVTLAGTLTIPEGEGPFPAVALVSGSGPQDRDETIMEHKPFLVLADHLTRNGIAVLRYDDRGTAQSTGDYSTATSVEFADDAEAAVRFLRSRPEVDSAKVGLVGHSEGAMIAPMVANRGDATAFVVLLAPPGVSGAKVSISQSRTVLALRGVPEEKLAEVASAMETLFAAIARGDGSAEVREQFEQFAPGVLVPPGADQAMLDLAFHKVNSPWMRYFLTYDPLPALRKLKVPALALWGEMDQQVLVDVNAGPVQKALTAGHEDSAAEVLPGLNHLFQTCETGDMLEYARIEETMSTVALERITAWVSKVVNNP